MATPDKVSLEDTPEARYEDGKPTEYRVMFRSKASDEVTMVMLTTDLEAARRRRDEDPNASAGELWIEQRANRPWSRHEGR